MATGAVAVAILVWGVVEMVQSRIDKRPGTNSTGATEDSLAPSPGTRPPATRPETQPTAAPPGTRLYSEVFSVSDAVLHRGTWFVLDRRGTQVHRISEAGSLLGSFGREGEGPGEFSRPVAIAARGDTVIVLDGTRLQLYDLEGSHVADRRAELGACGSGAVRDLLLRPWGLLLLVNCRAPDRMGWLVLLNAGDAPPETLAARTSEPGVVDLRMTDAVLAAHPEGFVFGLAAYDCLDTFSPQGAELGQVCHDWIERLPSPPELEDAMASLRGRASQGGVRVIESDGLPPFTDVYSIRGELAYQVPLPENLMTFRLVRRGPSGEAAALPLPVAEGFFVTGNAVLMWWEDLEGMRIAIHALNGPRARRRL